MELQTIVFENAGSRIEIAQYGGQLLSWRIADGIERLYAPNSLRQETGRALRGGVPVCFPQFANRGPVMKHGFARLLPWQVMEQNQEKIVLALSDNEYTRSIWNYRFDLEQHISFSENALCIELLIKNRDVGSFSFTTALHSYVRVDDVLNVWLLGLKGVQYEDALQANLLKTEQNDTVIVVDELDRVYHNPPAQLQLMQPEQKTLLIEQEGFTDTVVWNPGALKATELKDMPTADWQYMLCVEASVVGKAVSLAAGQEWRGLQRFVLI
jgi:glucose-6-phosphate 1-epimerase